MPDGRGPASAENPLLCSDSNHSAPILSAIQTAGVSAPSSVAARGLIDTGSDLTVVAPWILQQLRIPPQLYTTQTQGIGGPVSVRLFKVSLSILDTANAHLPWFVQPDLLVMEASSALHVDVLIGMDVLLGCRMIVDGPARLLTLDF